jgi:hypothetical protein
MVGFLSAVILVLLNPVQLLIMIVEPVVAEFILHPQQHE